MKILLTLFVLLFSSSVVAEDDTIPDYCYYVDGVKTKNVDISKDGCYITIEADAVVSGKFDPNSITGIFGIEFGKNIQDYELDIAEEKKIDWFDSLSAEEIEEWTYIIPIKKNIYFSEYIIKSPVSSYSNIISQIAAIGSLDTETCNIAINKITQIFYNNYIEFYRIDIQTDINNKRIYFDPKVYEQFVVGQSYMLELSCFDGSIIIKLINLYLQNTIKKQINTEIYHQLNTENILN